MKDKIYSILPHFLQNILVTLYNIIAYKQRYGGNYKSYLKQYKKNHDLSRIALEEIQRNKFRLLISNSYSKSKFYNELYLDMKDLEDINKINSLPIIDKELFRKEIQNIYTINSNEGIHGKTGGTTGKSLEVLYTKDNMQERFALLDNFRSQFGYELGKKTAWFSGKNLLTNRDLKKNRFWKTDNWYHVRYYSTFHIKEEYLKFYIDDLIKFAPLYMVGFPSNMAEIARYGLAHNVTFPENCIKAVFPTAETVTEKVRIDIESFFKTRLYDQYASSEGAPFIFECANKKLHLELQSGVFEVLNEKNEPTNYGRLVVTSFTTYGTPLIRYDIGDMLQLSDETCSCGNCNPMVKQILGRIDDFVYSPENGKINLGNVSNTLKGTKGIVKFQVVQDRLDELLIKLIIDKDVYNQRIEQIFLSNWKDRVGNQMLIALKYVTDIPIEKSGKYRIVKNNIKHLISK